MFILRSRNPAGIANVEHQKSRLVKLVVCDLAKYRIECGSFTVHQKTPEITLAPKLKRALSDEMKALQESMMQLVPSIASGDWDQVERIANKMESSYILKQQLSKQERQALHHTLPVDFQTQDHKFHKMAGMLGHVANHRHIELVTFYFYKLSEACVSCHSTYAIHRFPAFASESHDHH